MNANRRVLVLNHFARPRHMPGGTRHVELFSRLDGWDARVIAGDRGLRGSDWQGRDGLLETVCTSPHSGNGVTRVLNWMSFSVTSFLRGVRTRPLDLVYASSPHLFAALSGWAIARVRRVPFVLEVRDIWPKILVEMGTLPASSIVYRCLVQLECFLYRHADRVVYMADGVEQHLLDHGVPQSCTLFIPNGADAADFVPSAPRDVLRQRFGFEGVVAVYAGAHGPANGLNLLLDAASALRIEAPDVHIVLVGDGVEKCQLVQRADRERLTNVRFMDPIPKEQIPDLLSAADIGVHCLADIEMFHTGVSPNKLYDYLAAGLPAITNTPGVCAEFVEASGGGVAVLPSCLSNGLSKLAAMNEADRQETGKAGRAYMAATRSRTAMAGRLQTLLDELVPRPRTSADTAEVHKA